MNNNLNTLLTIVNKNRHEDLISLINLWIDKKSLSSLKDINLFINELTHFVTKLNNHNSFENLYNIAKTISNNSGILEMFIPICSNDLEFANAFIKYYNETNDKLINNCLKKVSKYRHDNLKEKLYFSIGNIGPIYICEVNNLINSINNDISFNNIYKIHEYFDKCYHLFNDIMDDISYENIRCTILQEFIYYKKNPSDDINSNISYFIVDVVKDQILSLLKIGCKFHDILELCRVKPWNYNLVILPILNYIAINDSINGPKLKKYFEENYDEENENEKIKIYTNDL